MGVVIAVALLATVLCSTSVGFDVIWNVPTQQCLKKYQMQFPALLKQYGILVNEGDKFQGEAISIFYESQLGLYPHLSDSKTFVNGGIPQLGNLDLHLKKAAVDLETILPNKSAPGLRVIDWEAWRPTWKFNWGSLRIYQNMTKDRVRKLHPSWSDSAIAKYAETEWEESAKNWMLETLRLAKKLRPKNDWCYYLFPDCYNYDGDSPETFQCSENIRKGNDELSWLWQSSTAICPSVYLYEEQLTKYSAHRRAWFTNGRLQEALRVSNSGAKIYPYVNYSWKPGTMVPKEDFWRIMAQAASLGLDGVVVWGSSASVNSEDLCLQLQDYITDTLGPASEKIRWNAARCSNQVCNSQGSCTWPNDNCVIAWKLLAEKEQHDFIPADIHCRCHDGYRGRFCETKEKDTPIDKK